MKFGIELTFFPAYKKGKWKEFLDIKEAEEVAKRFNDRLSKYDAELKKCGLLFFAKADPFRLDHLENQPHTSYCIEINAFSGYQIILNSNPEYKQAISRIFEVAKSLQLVARFSKLRNGVLIDYPNGGGHIHTSMDWFYPGNAYFSNMAMVEKAICIDYYNNPWIKWLFAQWSDNTNSRVAFNPNNDCGITKIDNENEAWNLSLSYHCCSIFQRFAVQSKGHYPTYEFRFFNAQANADELFLDMNFLYRWIAHYIQIVEYKDYYGNKEKLDKAYTLTLDKDIYKKLSNLSYAKKTINDFFTNIGLDFKDYQAKFEENYARRMNYGKKE